MQLFAVSSSATFSKCHWWSWHAKFGPLHVFFVWPYLICNKDNRKQLSVVILWLFAKSFEVKKKKVILLTGKAKISTISTKRGNVWGRWLWKHVYSFKPFPSPLLKFHVLLRTFPQKISLLSICFFIQFFLSGSKLSSQEKKNMENNYSCGRCL